MPRLSLNDLATAWLPKTPTIPVALPSLNNELGAIQAEADIAAIKHPAFPPYSEGNELTAVTLLGGRQLAQFGAPIEMQWRAYELKRRCRAGDWMLRSETALTPNAPGCLVKVEITNATPRLCKLDLGSTLSGRARNADAEGYSGRVPSVPMDVFGLMNHKHLQQTVSVEWPGALCFTNDEGNAYSVQGVWPAPDSWANERTPIWGRWLRPKATFVVCLFFAFSNDRVHAIASARLWWRRETVLFRAARIWWENLWDATFTCGNDEFSGFLPEVDSNIDAQNRLYYNGSGV